MTDPKTATVSMVLNVEETKQLLVAKEKTGIKNSSDLFRFLLTQYTKDDAQ